MDMFVPFSTFIQTCNIWQAVYSSSTLYGTMQCYLNKTKQNETKMKGMKKKWKGSKTKQNKQKKAKENNKTKQTNKENDIKETNQNRWASSPPLHLSLSPLSPYHSFSLVSLPFLFTTPLPLHHSLYWNIFWTTWKAEGWVYKISF